VRQSLRSIEDRIAYLDAVRASGFAHAYKDRVVRMLELAPGLDVLDVGCGTGDDARGFAARVGSTGRVVGVDLEAAMVEAARERARDSKGPVEFEVADVLELPFPDASFDRCVADRVFQLLRSEQPRALAELVRVCRPGGAVLASNPAAFSAFDIGAPDVTHRIVSHMAAGSPAQPFIGSQLPNLFKDAGLANVLVDPCAHWWNDFEEADRITPMDVIARAALDGGAITRDEHDAWLSRLSAAVAEDRFTFVSVILSVRGERV